MATATMILFFAFFFPKIRPILLYLAYFSSIILRYEGLGREGFSDLKGRF